MVIKGKGEAITMGNFIPFQEGPGDILHQEK